MGIRAAWIGCSGSLLDVQYLRRGQRVTADDDERCHRVAIDTRKACR